MTNSQYAGIIVAIVVSGDWYIQYPMIGVCCILLLLVVGLTL